MGGALKLRFLSGASGVARDREGHCECSWVEVSYKVNGPQLSSYSSGLVSCHMVPDHVTGLGNLA